MLVNYNEKEVKFTPISKFKYIDIRIFLISLITMGLVSLTNVTSRPTLEDITYEERILIVNEYNSFSENKLVETIKKYNFRFPHIVLAQAKLETHNFKSNIFIENNNLFGMKEAKVRLNTAEGTQRSHASYSTWQNSLIDYALYSATYLSKLRTEEEYFNYLSQNYAEDSDYVTKLKSIIEKEKLKESFK